MSVSDNMSVVELERLFPGESEMARRMRALDWSLTPLGSARAWPPSLKTSVNICLNSSFALFIWWSNDLLLLYNDAYSQMLGNKHPGALGQPGRECWSEIWDIIGPMLHSVLKTGKPTRSDDLFLPLERYGYPEECYFTFSYSPIYDENGGVGGVFTAAQETTEKVIGERRLRTLRDLAAQSIRTKEMEDVCRITAETLAQNPYDLPFACLYLLEDDRRGARLAGTAGIEAGNAISPLLASWDSLPEGSPSEVLKEVLKQVAETGRAAVIKEALSAHSGPLPTGAWSRSPQTLLVLPVTLPGNPLPTALLVAAVSPMRALDSAYRSFFDLVAGQVAVTLAEARAYEAERRRAEALAELDRAKTAFLSNISHEFRTPLMLILGPLEDELRENPQARERLEVAYRNALRLLKLVNTLLDFSRIEAGRIEAVYESTDLAVHTAELASVFRAAIEKAGLQLRVDCPALPEPVTVDREMWEKIILNLLSNAFKFTFEGVINVQLRWRGERVELEVADTGVGIPETELPHIFERFYRVRNTRSRTYEGTGIGLALVQELVRLHGGEVRVQSAENLGTTFTVSLPTGTAHLPRERLSGARSLASTASGATPFIEEALRWLSDEATGSTPSKQVSSSVAPRRHPPGEKYTSQSAVRPKILLVDDNADMCGYLRRLLEPQYEVLTAADGKACLAVARKQSPDLVLSDVMMPRLDGLDLLKELRADPRTQTIPIILLSARAGEEARVEGLEAGADDYLIKPFGARELLARVSGILALARSRQEVQRREAALLAERNRIARDLHDTLAEAFTSVLMQLGAAERLLADEPTRGIAHLQNVRNAAEAGLAAARRSVQALWSQGLEQTDLHSALANLVEQMDSGQAPRLQCVIDGAPQPLPPNLADALIHIGLEGLTNALLHARASQVVLRLTYAKTAITLAVEDDGRGDDSQSTDEGSGLQSIREHTERHGGQFHLVSQPGQGTTLRVVFPLKSARRSRSRTRIF